MEEVPFVSPFHRSQSITGGGGGWYLRPTLKAQLLLPGSLSQWKEHRVECCMFFLQPWVTLQNPKLAVSRFLHLQDEGRELFQGYGSLER